MPSLPTSPPSPPSEPEAPSWGDSLKAAMRTYGPIVAAAIPAIILARGEGGREIGNILKRFAPEHFAKAQRAPYPYMIEANAGIGGALGPSFSTLRDTTGKAPTIWDKLAESMYGRPRLETGGLFDAAQSALGTRPETLGYLNVPPGPKQGDLASSAMHEFGHLMGFERARSQYPRGNPTDQHILGAPHLDILDDPKTRAILQSGMKNPDLRDYFATRLGGAYSQPHEALGELLTELWAKRMMERSGGRYLPIESAAGRASRVDPMTAARMASVANTGRLSGADRDEQMRALTTLLNRLQGAGASPARPSPGVPARGASGLPGSAP